MTPLIITHEPPSRVGWSCERAKLIVTFRVPLQYPCKNYNFIATLDVPLIMNPYSTLMETLISITCGNIVDPYRSASLGRYCKQEGS